MKTEQLVIDKITKKYWKNLLLKEKADLVDSFSGSETININDLDKILADRNISVVDFAAHVISKSSDSPKEYISFEDSPDDGYHAFVISASELENSLDSYFEEKDDFRKFVFEEERMEIVFKNSSIDNMINLWNDRPCGHDLDFHLIKDIDSFFGKFSPSRLIFDLIKSNISIKSKYFQYFNDTLIGFTENEVRSEILASSPFWMTDSLFTILINNEERKHENEN